MTPYMQPAGEQNAPWIERRRRIAAEPDNDELRLQYAVEWEREGLDRTRSRLIQVQVRLAQLAEGVDHPDWLRLSLEARSILAERAREWAAAWFEAEGVREAEFHGGFIEFVTAPASVLLNPDRRRSLLGDDPIRHINIVGIESERDFTMIVSSPEMKRLISLSADGQGLGDESMFHLAWRSNLTNLRWLSVASNEIGEAGVRAVAAASLIGQPLRYLEYAEFRGNPADPGEQFAEDQGIVVGRRLPELARRLEGPPRWLQREVVAGRVLIPNRLEIGRRASGSVPGRQ